MLKKVTENIAIQVETQFVPEESAPERNHYFFAYKIKIENIGAESVQLLNRHWIIQDQTGHRQDVKGPGVVGKQPHLKPGESFEYTSYCPLHTPIGSMQGSYEMLRTDGTRFLAEIPLFDLIMPGTQPVFH